MDTIDEILNKIDEALNKKEIVFEKVTKELFPFLYEDTPSNLLKPNKPFSYSKSNYTVEDLIKALSKLDKNKEIVIDTTEWPGNTIKIIEDNDGKYVLSPYGI